MDDVTLGGPRTTVSLDINPSRIEGAKLGLNLNVLKCEVISQDQRPSLPIQVAVGLHRGLKIYEAHTCPCGADIARGGHIISRVRKVAAGQHAITK